MLVSEILRALPDVLEWMVMFNLSAISELADDITIRKMYHLPEGIDLQPYSHAVLTSHGRFLALKSDSKLVEPFSQKTVSRGQMKTSLYERFSNQLEIFPVDEADCLGLGEKSPYSPVLLHLQIKSGYGEAQAIFEHEPTKEHYELLRAVGVKFLGGEAKNSYYLAKFQNRLPVHIHAGILSHFSRTAHCNVFFLQHGHIDPNLEAGLIQASQDRVNFGKNRSLKALVQLAEAACEKPMSMTCQPPLPDKPFDYGDLVPLGFVLKALNKTETLEASQTLSEFLLSKREGNLWAFHTNRLITSTDSALVLQGFINLQTNLQTNSQAVEDLEIFADGEGGYYPQLWAKDKQPGKMLFDESVRHWCQSDYATTCLIKTLRQEAGLEEKTSTQYLADAFEYRSGLYFANPYLVDWVLACAISKNESAKQLRQTLLVEMLASINDDYSFGVYDVPMSTALAILSMAALGFRGRTMRVAQLRLLEFMDGDGLFPAAMPFYSTLRIDPEAPPQALLNLLTLNAFATNRQQQIRQIHGQHHSISLYIDCHKMITTALAVLALSEECSSTQPDLDLSKYQQEIHPRYQCQNHSEYIAKYALPSYV